MGRTATHAIVYAHLRIPDGSGGYKKLGLHGFILQMRSLEDHTLMPGVLAGDIGTQCTQLFVTMTSNMCMYLMNPVSLVCMQPNKPEQAPSWAATPSTTALCASTVCGCLETTC